MIAYKFLREGGRGPYSKFTWPLPTRRADGTWEPGEWVEATGELVLCENGIHACRAEDVLTWLDAEMYEVELGGEIVEGKDKLCARRGRLLRRVEAWDMRTARVFATRCARRVWHLLTSEGRQAVRVARLFADGKATDEELAAARAAAWVAAWVVAEAAAWAAARAAAWAAAWAAAEIAAGAAARDAAGVAERDWQSRHLFRMLGEPRTTGGAP